jgi:bla regulator protein blaR1
MNRRTTNGGIGNEGFNVSALVQTGLTNALAAAALALIAAVAGKLCRRPALRHALWLLVLVKLVTPPLVLVPVPLPDSAENPADTSIELPAQPALQFSEIPFEAQDKDRKGQSAKAENDTALPVSRVNAAESLAPARAPVAFLPKALRNPQLPAEGPHTLDPGFTFADVPWWTILGAIWLGGSVTWFAIALLRIRRFQCILRKGRAASMALQREASMLAQRMGLRDCPGVCLVPGVVSPLLWAVVGYPRLLLPADLCSRLDPLQRQILLTHELAHYRRRDHWVRCLEFLALGLYWWFPVVWWARRELREAEEVCCDAWVLWTLPQAAKAYASALVETLDFLSHSQLALPPAASGLGQLDLLRKRLTMIMRGTMPRNLGGLGFLAVLGLAVLLLPMVPSWAQQETKPGIPGDPNQPPMDLQKAKAELDRAAAELSQFRLQLEQMHREFEKKTRMLEEAENRLRDAMKAQEMTKKTGGGFGGGFGGGKGGGGGGGGFGGQGGKGGGGGGGGFPGFQPNPATEKRLSELEKKLDMVLDELQEMRKSMDKKGPPLDDPFKGGKKGGGKKGGFGPGPGGGGKGGPPRATIPPHEFSRRFSIDEAPALSARMPRRGEIT